MGIDILIIKMGRLSEGSGRCPENPQGTSPLTLCPGAARTRPRRKQERSRAPFRDKRMIREAYVKGLSRHILTGGSACPDRWFRRCAKAAPPAVPVFHGSLDNASAPRATRTDEVVGKGGRRRSVYARIMQRYAGREDFRKDFRIKGFS